LTPATDVTIYEPNPAVQPVGDEPAEFVEPPELDPAEVDDDHPDPTARPSGTPPVERAMESPSEPYTGSVTLGDDGKVRIVVAIDDLDSASWSGTQRAGDEPIALEAFDESSITVTLSDAEHERDGERASATVESAGTNRVRLVGTARFHP
jgi:hypothetical protein